MNVIASGFAEMTKAVSRLIPDMPDEDRTKLIDLLTTYAEVQAMGKRQAMEQAVAYHQTLEAKEHLEQAALIQRLPIDHYTIDNPKGSEQAYDLLCENLAIKGAASRNFNGSMRGSICRKLDNLLPNEITETRYMLISKLAALAAITVASVLARSLVMKGHT